MAKLHKQNDGGVPVTEMKDGDLAVITQWPNADYFGCVVQRYSDFLITIGAKEGKSWGRFFADQTELTHCRVRILQPGELIEV